MKFSPKKPSKFQTLFRNFYSNTFFAPKKANLPIFLIINLKAYEILVVKFIQNLLIDLIKQLFDLFKRKGLFWALF